MKLSSNNPLQEMLRPFWGGERAEATQNTERTATHSETVELTAPRLPAHASIRTLVAQAEVAELTPATNEDQRAAEVIQLAGKHVLDLRDTALSEAIPEGVADAA